MTRTNKGLLMKDDLIINHRLIPYTCLFKPKYRRNKLITVNKTRNLKPFLLCFQSRCCQEVDHWVLSWSLGHCQCHCHCLWTPEPVTVVWSISVSFLFHVIKHYYQHHSSIHFWTVIPEYSLGLN